MLEVDRGRYVEGEEEGGGGGEDWWRGGGAGRGDKATSQDDIF